MVSCLIATNYLSSGNWGEMMILSEGATSGYDEAASIYAQLVC